MAELSIEANGFFEGLYDLSGYDIIEADRVARKIPVLGRGDLGRAKPMLSGFPDPVKEQLGSLGFPYRTSNELVQIGLQDWMLGRVYGVGVPDAYRIEYCRSGRFAGSDKQKSLYVHVVRDPKSCDAMDAYLNLDANDAQILHARRVVEKGQSYGNAVLAMQTGTHSYVGLIDRTTQSHVDELRPVTNPKLALAAFETVLYWVD